MKFKIDIRTIGYFILALFVILTLSFYAFPGIVIIISFISGVITTILLNRFWTQFLAKRFDTFGNGFSKSKKPKNRINADEDVIDV